jgi:hypothetical protein
MENGPYYSSHGQDKWIIDRVFRRKRGGWFVDSGAGPDGIKGSNSYALESQFGWTGLLVEPHAESSARIRKNRTAIVEQCCLTDSYGEVEFVIHEWAGLSSMPQHLSEPDYVGAGFDRKQFQKVRVPGIPLWELLRRHYAPVMIDYLSLDIEGAEWLALKSFPFSEFRFLAMTIERNGKSYDKLRTKLGGEGYRLVHVTDPDDYYVHASVDYAMSVGEKLETRIRSLWNTIYYHEPALTARRGARSVRNLLSSSRYK